MSQRMYLFYWTSQIAGAVWNPRANDDSKRLEKIHEGLCFSCKFNAINSHTVFVAKTRAYVLFSLNSIRINLTKIGFVILIKQTSSK